MGETGLIEGKKHAAEHLGRVLVLGLGKTGIATVNYCIPLLGGRVDSITVYAGRRTDAAEAFVAGLPDDERISVVFDSETVEGSFDICVASPGISAFSDFFGSAKEASSEIVSDVEFAWRESASDSVWVAITGTNGKTTTTSLTAHILKNAGLAAEAVGNIGNVCLDEVAKGTTRYYVTEIASMHLAVCSLLATRVSVLLNVTPDHLDWHRGFENYAKAKCSVFQRLDKELDERGHRSVAVMDASDEVVRTELRRLRNDEGRWFDYIPVGTASGYDESMIARCGSENAAYREDGRLVVEYLGVRHDLGSFDELQIKGSHNCANALASASAALALGLSDDEVIAGLRSFAPLEHRIEPCGSFDGISFVNDSKGTNVDATVKAYSAFKPGRVVVLLGGKDKGTDLADLVKATVETCHAAVVYGAAGERFEKAFVDAAEAGECGDLKVVRAAHMEDALDTAIGLALPGDTVLLSPACSSFDEFTCFEERGEIFKRLVAKRIAQAAQSGDPEKAQPDISAKTQG